MTDIELGNVLIRYYNQSPDVPPEELSEKDFLKAYRGALACEARIGAVFQSAVGKAIAAFLPKNT